MNTFIKKIMDKLKFYASNCSCACVQKKSSAIISGKVTKLLRFQSQHSAPFFGLLCPSCRSRILARKSTNDDGAKVVFGKWAIYGLDSIFQSEKQQWMRFLTLLNSTVTSVSSKLIAPFSKHRASWIQT